MSIYEERAKQHEQIIYALYADYLLSLLEDELNKED